MMLLAECLDIAQELFLGDVPERVLEGSTQLLHIEVECGSASGALDIFHTTAILVGGRATAIRLLFDTHFRCQLSYRTFLYEMRR